MSDELRRSERSTKGKQPSYLNNYVTDNKKSEESDNSGSGTDEDLDETILPMLTEDMESLVAMIKELSDKLTTVQTEMAASKDELNKKMDDQNQVFKIQLEEMNGRSSIQPANTTTATTTSTPIASTVTTSSTTTMPTAGFSGNLLAGSHVNSQMTMNQMPTSMHYTPYKKRLVPLTSYDGNPMEWLTFLAEYRRTTAENHYSSSENTSRFNECLKGDARTLVKWLLTRDDMADKIVERLEGRFGRPELLVEFQTNELMETLEISEANIQQIVPFADKVVNFANFLSNDTLQHHLNNPMLLKDLIKKLPMTTRIQWANHVGAIEGVITILDFSNWIEVIAENISRVPLSKPPTLPAEKKKPAKGRLLHTAESSSRKQIACSYCSKSHHITDCPEFAKKTVDDKWTIVKEKTLCFSCLSAGHPSRNCRRKKTCIHEGCKKIHHPQLHNEPKQERDETSLVVAKTVVNCHAASNEGTPKVLFKMVPVKIYSGDKVVSTLALFDEGSSISLMDKNLAQRLGLSGSKRKLNLQWFGDHCSSEESEMVKFEISGVHSSAEIFEMNNVCTVKSLGLPMQTLNISQLNQKYSYLRNLPIADYEDGKPELLIGLDYCYLGISRKKIRHASNGPIVVESPLGWIAYGRGDDQASDSNAVRMFYAKESLEELDIIVKDYFTTENFGVKLTAKTLESLEDRRALQLLESTTKRAGERYESGLLWRSDNVVLPDSYGMALSRLTSIEAKMKKDPVYASKYKQTISSYLQKGYARQLTVDEILDTKERIWYLPHFGVLNPNKPDKFRLVFDAAAAVDGTSLNSALLSGPDMNQPLLTILSKFREGRIGVCGDIREMYHQVLIRHEDQDAQRFLWRNDRTGVIEVFKMLVMTFGSTSSPATAQYVKNCNASQFLEDHPKAASAVIQLHYVDDYVSSYNDEEEAILITMKVRDIQKAAGFDLRGYISNSRKVASALNQEDMSQSGQVDMDLEKSSSCDKILGMVWNTSKDEFMFQLNFNRIEPMVLERERTPTKREFLAIVMSVYDPFGFLADFLVYMKVLLQLVWRSGIDWDQPLPEHLHERWCAWSKELVKVREFRVPRCYSEGLASATAIELHTFVDSSEVAFSAVCYLRIITQEGIDVSFVIGKTKCAPVKFLSIPRLELQAAVLGVRLHNTVLKAHTFNVGRSVFWSDSKTVLHWINDDKRKYKTFVANRIGEILDTTKPTQWNWISTHQNAADDATRDTYPPEFKLRRRWIEGPEWLMEEECTWPHQPQITIHDEEDLELQPLKRIVMIVRRQAVLFDFTRSSSYVKVQRIYGWMMRYLSNFVSKMSSKPLQSGELSVSEIERAEVMIFRSVQQEAFEEEYQQLAQQTTVNKKSEIYQLSPILDDNGLIRLSGRIDNAPTLPLYTRRPIILPKRHQLTNLVVQHYHNKFRHQNEELIMCEIRRKFWVNDLRVLVRSAKKRCQHCKNEAAKPVTPQMGQLPADRLTPYIRPFTFTGLDYFGPVFVTVGRRQEKRWVALFTCLTIRAVHLEIVESLSTDACIMCLRNFFNLRGVPSTMRSDNATTFVGAKGELTTVPELYNQAPILSESTMRGMQWLFNCPANPSAGGCWERLVRSVKRVLKQSLKETAPRGETLRSYLMEAANIVNSRPLTHVPVSSIEEEPLTPNSFLLGETNAIHCPGPDDEKLWTFRKQWRIANALKNHFWRRWVREYLPVLARRTKDFDKKDPIKVGDLVIVCDEDVPRRQWIRGIVEQTFPAKDGQIRRVQLRTNGRTLHRPVSKLAILDVDGKSTLDQKELNYGGRNVAASTVPSP